MSEEWSFNSTGLLCMHGYSNYAVKLNENEYLSKKQSKKYTEKTKQKTNKNARSEMTHIAKV